ncbi:MAG: 2-succinyl-5-enolpyruvyl-6-hydroxy-3-cyclohexene-1-carboxylic-acid synthase [Candidatus Eisenbacteria bacterium]
MFELNRNLQTEWAGLLIDALVRAGIREAVVSPGSRSTPVALAAVRHRGLRVRSIVDERSAAFFALGQAKTTGAPSLLICTSGTAGAHYYPAVIEADRSYTPLVVITADRPPELHGNAAPQTTDQIRLFGSYARRYHELGLPDGDTDALRALRRKAAQAVFDSRHPTPGAVHLNAWFRKPLEPGPPGADRELEARVAEIRSEPFPAAYPAVWAPDPGGVDALAEACRGARRGLIVCGPAPLARRRSREAVAALAETLQFPLLAEGTSQVRFTGIARPLRCDGFDTFLRAPAFRDGHRPELVIQVGAPPTSKAWERYLRAHPPCPRFVIAPHGWNDPQNTATALLTGVIDEVGERLKESMGGPPYARPSRWTEDFAAADGLVWRFTDEWLRSESGAITKAALARAVVSSLRGEAILAVANSLAIREVDGFCPGAMMNAGVWHQKGVNGIDGLISGAAGAASVSGGPVTLYMGDLAFLHDLQGLAAARDLDHPFLIVVAQNNGGRIFEQLPIAGSSEVEGGLLEFWTTPHGLDFSHAAALFGHGYRKVLTEADLREALAEAHRVKGCSIVEAVVPPSAAAEEHARLTRAVAEAIAGAAR